jgi:hypothetical protein
MTSKPFSFSSGTWFSLSLHPVVDDNQSALASGIYRWDIQSSSVYEYTGTGYVLQYDVSQTEPWSISSSVWSGTSYITRPTSTTVKVEQVISGVTYDRGTWIEADAFVDGTLPSSTGGSGPAPTQKKVFCNFW